MASAESIRSAASELAIPGEVLGRLRQGNARWAAGQPLHPDQSVARREALANQQCPFAVVITCIDSRVAPEMIFDTGIGDLFVVRTAAHAMDGLATGSVEYGPAQLHTPLVVVLGHQRCGAVTAAEKAIRENTPLPGHMGEIVDALQPVYEAACHSGADRVERMVRAHTRRSVDTLRHNPLLTPLVEEGRLDIVGGYYSLETGRVDFFPEGGPASV